jgi:cation:H+ antiporter
VDIAIGNVVGSTIFNIFFILGASAVIYPVQVISASILDLWINILAGFLLFLFLFTGKGRRLESREGIILIFIHIVYIFML